MKRVLLAMVLVLALLLSVSVLSFAADGQVELQYTVPASYKLVIPATTVSLTSGSGEFSLSMTGNIDSLDVMISSDHGFNLVNGSNAPIGYTLSEAGVGDLGKNDPVVRVSKDTYKTIYVSIASGDVTGAKAGTYTDTLTFTVQ